jgi:cytochrome c biogenesis protein CcdA
MSLAVLSIVLVAMLVLRVGFIALQFNNLDLFWYDLERQGIRFQVARALSIVTSLAYWSCAIYTLWSVRAQPAFWPRYGTVFVAWFGIALLSRFALHKFPRTNSSQLMSDAQASLIANFVTSLISGLGMTGLTALYFWLRP